ncbi:hypothetical protein KEJ39_07205 [Candidatus Bathyarchaeota archaeon]|nr:hypothetical protein [Candidatus Bathyarchaeota archaeon]
MGYCSDLLHLQGKRDGLDLEAVEHWMGHEVDPNHRDKFNMDKQYLLDQYRTAEKHLNIMSGKVGQSMDLQAELTRLLSNIETRRELASRQAFQQIIKEAVAQLVNNTMMSAEAEA